MNMFYFWVLEFIYTILCWVYEIIVKRLNANPKVEIVGVVIWIFELMEIYSKTWEKPNEENGGFS